MCGIFGYVGTSRDGKRSRFNGNAAAIILDGLKRLEYRGYDSWGIAVLGDRKQIAVEKKVGAIGEINPLSKIFQINSEVGIGHTRWATHGSVIEKNAHPHVSRGLNFAVAHNGIVENFKKLKSELTRAKFTFKSETDTEVIVGLVEQELKPKKNHAQASLVDAVRKAFIKLEGRNTVIVLSDDGEIIACRNGSPLVIGESESGEILFSSDTLSFAGLVNKVVVVDNGQMAVCNKKKPEFFNIKSGKKAGIRWEQASIAHISAGKEGFEHYMLKEIHEEPIVIENLTKQDKKPLLKLAKLIKKAKNVYVIGSGTTGIAAAQISYYLRAFGEVRAIALVGADAYEYFDLFQRGDLLIAPSQSGETADVIEVVEMAKKKGVIIASNVNMPGSMMTKLSDFKFMTGAGPEVCVVSTKVFIAHIAWGYLLSKAVQGKYGQGIKNLQVLTKNVKKYLNDRNNLTAIKSLVKFLLPEEHIFLLGKAQNFNIIREGMIKLIETSYKHAHAMPAGDLKHYAITLMEPGVPVIVAISQDMVRDDVLNAVSQVKARGAYVIGLSQKNNEDFDFFLKVPNLGEVASVMNVVPLQLLAYYLAVGQGNNVDRPRNIAKSVTVK